MDKLAIADRSAVEVGQADFFQALLDSMTEGVSLASEDGVIVYSNPAEDKMFGYAPGELVGQHVSVQNAYSPDENQQRVEDVIRELKARGRWEGEWRNRRKDGTSFYTAARITSVQVGGRTHWLCVQRDVTEERDLAARQKDDQARLSIAISAAKQGVWDWDVPTGRMVYSERAREIYGFSPDEPLSYDQVRDATHPEDLPNTSALARRALDPAIRDRSSYEYRIIHPDGSIRWALAYGEAVFDETTDPPRPLRYVGTIQDITEEKDARERLRTSENLLSLFVEDAPVGIALFDREMRYRAVSRRFAEDLGLDDHQGLIGKSHYDIFPDIPDEWRAVHNRVLAGEEIRADEDAFARDDGTIQYVRWAMKPWLAANGSVGGAIIFSEIITDQVERRHQLELAIRDLEGKEKLLSDSERRMRTVLESVSDCFYAVDPQWQVTLFNRSAEEYFGIRREHALGRTLWDVLPATTSEDVANRLRQAMSDRQRASWVTASTFRPGTWLELRIAPKEGGGLAVSFTDVSERVRADRARDLLVNELNHRVKNTLAVVQSLAQHSFRGSDPATEVSAFEGRLTALAAAHNLLTRRNWEGATIGDVVAEALRPFTSPRPDAFELNGAPIEVTTKTAVNLALCLNELATNAVKYGALSGSAGKVALSWSSTEADGFVLSWKEIDGPAVAQPEHAGFGTRMIKRVLAVELGGSVDLRFEPDGLSCVVRAPAQATA